MNTVYAITYDQHKSIRNEFDLLLEKYFSFFNRSSLCC